MKRLDINWSNIYCEECARVRPLMQRYLPKSGGDDYKALELVCAICGRVIATLDNSEEP